jgi:hypothetical protein
MPRILRTIAVAGACVITSATAVLAQRVITGQVLDPAGAPVAYANLDLGAKRVVADDSGRFRVSVGPGSGVLHVRRIGFKPTNTSYAAGGDTSLTVQLDPIAQRLEAALIEATGISRALELHGFYRRLQEREKGINSGQFITAEEIEQRNPHRIGQMLDGRTGIRMQRPNQNPGVGQRGANGAKCTSASDPRCWAPVGLNGCYMDVYMDGRRLTSVSLKNEPTYIDEYILPSHIAGIEIYTTAGRVPPEYQSLSGTCGVLLFWSK